MKFKDKPDFLNTVETEWSKFQNMLKELDDEDMLRPGVWGKNWTVKDMLAHIHEWHLMCLGWHKQGQKGPVEMPAPGYKWSETPRLNQDIYERYKDIPLADAKKKMKASHGRMVKLAESLTPAQLLKPGQFEWCGKNAITTYLAGAIVSHYRWGQKKIKQWKKTR